MAQKRQSRPDSGLGLQLKFLQISFFSFIARKRRGAGDTQSYPTRSVFKVVLQKSTAPPELILYYYYYKEQVDDFLWELTFLKTTFKTLCVT